MNVKECIRKNGWIAECSIPAGIRFMTVDIRFVNSDKEEDETQFTINGYDTNELSDLFADFCKENGFSKNTVTACIIVATAPTREELE